MHTDIWAASTTFRGKAISIRALLQDVAVDQTQHHDGRSQAPERKAICKYQGLWRRDLSRVSVKAWACPLTLSESRVADRTVLRVILHEMLADR